MKSFLICVIWGIVLLAFGVISIIKELKRSARCTEHTPGYVVDVIKDQRINDDGNKTKRYSYTPVFEYMIDGKTFRSQSNVSTGDKYEYKIGDSVNILYNPQQPDEFLIKGKSKKSGIGFGVVLTLLGILIIALGFMQI